MIKHLRSSLTILAFGLLTASSPAATLQYNAVLSVASNIPGGPAPFDITTTAFFPAAPYPTLTGTLNPGDQFRLVYSAPAGMRFQINPKPADANSYLFAVVWSTTNSAYQGLLTEGTGSSIEFDGLIGAVPTPLAFRTRLDQVNAFGAEAVFAGAEMSFRSISLLFNLPSTISKTFNNFAPPTVLFRLDATRTSTTGPLASLVEDTNPNNPVPEPSTLALAAAALAALAFSRRSR